ncbi:MAG: Ig domain-containing protein [Bacteroidales bacterium]|nr:Ig domain-containing protein [Bacteroidales bacterium]
MTHKGFCITRLLLSALLALVLLPGCEKGIDVTSVGLSETSISLAMGETTTLVATVVPSIADYSAIKWISSDPSVATVSEGRVQVHKAGTALITASAGGVTSGICTVTVRSSGEIAAEPSYEGSEAEVEAVTGDDTETEVESEAESDEAEEPGTVTDERSDDTAMAEVAADTETETEAETEAEASPESKYHFIYDVDFGEEGSYIPVDSLVTLYDWRGRNFNDYPTYWDYYGPVEITFDIANAECDLNGKRQPLPKNSVTLVQTKPGSTVANDPESGIGVSLPANRNGFLMCKFTTVGLTESFNIFIKAKVKYGFGTIQTDWITIKVVIEAGQ